MRLSKLLSWNTLGSLMPKRIAVALAAFGAAIGGFASTQNAVSPLRGSISSAAYQLLYGEQGPSAGNYRIKSLTTGFCIKQYLNGGVDYLTLHVCTGSDDDISILPHPAGGYTVRSAQMRLLVQRREKCATVARGVAFGPARIDNRNCELPSNASGWGDAGGNDQRFKFKRVGEGLYEIRTEQDECWDVAGRSTEVGASIIQWACTGEANQRFQLELRSPIVGGEEVAPLAKIGWLLGPDGPQRALPVRGVNMPAHDYVNYHTANDNGKECAARCVADTRCKAFTWAEPGYSSAPAMCWMKDRLSAPIADGRTFTGVVRP